MKAISIYQPYASALFLHLSDGSRLKRNETRGYKISYHGRILIHAAKTFPRWAKDFAMTERSLGRIPARLPIGCILGVVEIVGYRPTENIIYDISPIEKLYGDYSPGHWAWITNIIKEFKDPIPYRGQQGIFNVPDEIVREAMEP